METGTNSNGAVAGLPPRKLGGRPRHDGQPCRSSKFADRQLAKKRRCDRFVGMVKQSVGCCDCGFRAHPAALDFDHVTPGKKTNMSKLSSIRLAIKEMAMCKVRCANCHRVRTDGENKTRRKLLHQRDMFEEDYLDDDFVAPFRQALEALGKNSNLKWALGALHGA